MTRTQVFTRLSLSQLILLALYRLHVASGVAVTQETYHALTKDKKAVFLKLHVEWCSNCKEMKSDWDALEREYTDHPDILIGEVDCGSSAAQWCDAAFSIIGVPTLLYGDPSNDGMYLEEYREEKDVESLKRFTRTILTLPVCNPTNMGGCTRDERKLMESYWRRSVASLEKEIQDKEAQIQRLNDDLKVEFDRLQKDYNAKDLQHYIQKIDLKDSIRILNEVKAIIPESERRQNGARSRYHDESPNEQAEEARTRQ